MISVLRTFENTQEKLNMPTPKDVFDHPLQYSGIVDFETSYCCPYDPDELDKEVIEEFKGEFFTARDAQYDYSLEKLLYTINAIIPIENEKFAFTKAGCLFFGNHSRDMYTRGIRKSPTF